MLALGNLFRRKNRGVWQILVCLIVLSFLCRAAIPMGYMPEHSGGHDAGYVIALCTSGDGHDVAQPDLAGQADEPLSDKHANNKDCPFCIAVSQAMLPSQDAPVLLAVIVPRSILLPPRSEIRPPLPAQGPPLGSRAPPSNLV